MDLQGHKTGQFCVTQTFDVSHEVDEYAARVYQKDVVHRQMMYGLQQILMDGRRYEVQVTTTTVSGGQYPLYAQPDGAPCLAHPQGTPLDRIYSQYTLTCRAIIVLADPTEAKVGDCVSIGAFSMPPGDSTHRMTLWRPDEPDWTFVRVNVGWKRIS